MVTGGRVIVQSLCMVSLEVLRQVWAPVSVMGQPAIAGQNPNVIVSGAAATLKSPRNTRNAESRSNFPARQDANEIRFYRDFLCFER